ncbi:hypothetical protein Btru_054072 [Bulinus truncatus]|nr:hypothetical protein Btru_054072 [Bulinus truncatus]
MFFRRHWRSFLKRRVFLLILIFTLISIALMYHVLSSQSDKPSYDDVLLSAGQKRRFQPKHRFSDEHAKVMKKTSDAENNLDTSLYQNLIPNELDTLKNRDLLNTSVKEALMNVLLSLYPSNWANTPDTDEMALEVKHILADFGLESGMSCKDIDSLMVRGIIYSSQSKNIERGVVEKEQNYRFNYRSENNEESRSGYAIRSVVSDVNTKVACLKHIYNVDLCSTMGNYRLLREVVLLSTLRHPSIIRLNGYCLKGSRMSSTLQNKGVVIVTEVGVPFSQQTIFSSMWAQRVKYALQVAHLLSYMDKSPFDSLAFSKLDLKDFILAEGTTIKLADLDDIEVGEKICQKDSECIVQGLNKGVICKNGICEGLNSMSNLYLASQVVLIPLLYEPSGEEATQVVSSLNEHSLTTSALLSALKEVYKTLPKDQPKKKMKESIALKNNLEKGNADNVLKMFIRKEQKNFPGVYDYFCPESRVKWGCVVNVRSLSEAANLCLSDSKCEAFVTFSTHPETEKIMTVVLKNQTDSNPYPSSGTTMFLRRSTYKNKVEIPQAGGDASTSDEFVVSSNAGNCIDSVMHIQESARSTRESRLMTHMGLKNTREQVWRKWAVSHKLGTPYRIARLEGGGGRFQASLLSEEPSITSDKVTFIAEEGAKAYHKAYAIVYHLDRLLGLYHTPPCVGKTLSSKVVEQFSNNSAWGNTFKPLLKSDGSLKGIMVVPTPKVMKINKITLKPRATFITDLVTFDRPVKSQLEYVILWWLARVSLSDFEHLGYKGHLIHFSADKAFTDVSLDLSDYMNHCQFPNVVFKNLGCFRCVSQTDSQKIVSKICGLGEEVLKQAHSLLQDDADITIQDLNEQDITKMIDSTASDMLTMVDKCIRTHGREAVLY